MCESSGPGGYGLSKVVIEMSLSLDGFEDEPSRRSF